MVFAGSAALGGNDIFNGRVWFAASVSYTGVALPVLFVGGVVLAVAALFVE